MKQVLSKDGTPIAFETRGKGPAIILVDGALCYRASGPSGPLAALLVAHFTVFTYDRRGRGESGNTAPYATEREVEDIEALVHEAGGSAFVYGISSGAALALEAANRVPGITKLVLDEAPFIVDDSRPPIPKDFVARLNELLSEERRGDAVKQFLKLVGVPAPKRWVSVTAPTLVIDGAKSPAWMRHGMQALARVLPNAKLRTLEGQTHMVNPKALAPVLVEFFAG
jgi:pimeloyl-ACP methyl ester carboxylesterase